jgi:endonuclease III
VKAQDRIKAITTYVESAKRQNHAFESYPREILDLIVFHKLHFFLPEGEAAHCFRRLKSTFVDWNEIRISSVMEIQEVFNGSADSLELSIFVKDVLEQLHRENQSLDLEFLANKSMVDIRRFLRSIRGVEPATIDLILRLRKEYPVLPLSPPMESTLLRLGLVRPRDNREQKEKYLHNLVDQDKALPFHHFFLMHSREICPPDEGKILCRSCGIRRSCNYFARRQRRLNGKANRTR